MDRIIKRNNSSRMGRTNSAGRYRSENYRPKRKRPKAGPDDLMALKKKLEAKKTHTNRKNSKKQNNFEKRKKQGGKGQGGKRQGGRKRNKKIIYISVAEAVVIAAVSIFSINPYRTSLSYPTPYYELAEKYSEKYGVEMPLIYAVIKAESKFDANAVSSANAYGLMQILPSTGEWIAKNIDYKNYDDSLLFDPDCNIEFGCWYLNWLMKREALHYNESQNIDLIIAAYNAGHNTVENWLEDPKYSSDGKTLENIPYGETASYVKTVEKYYNEYKVELNKEAAEKNEGSVRKVLDSIFR